MLKIREGNQFTWAWAITRGAEPEDLSQATNVKFSYQFRDKSGRVNITEFVKSGNIISNAFLFTGVQGIVNLRLTYELPVIGPCTIDVDAFEIVASSEEASEAGEFSMTSDMAIALQGKNAYEVWLQTHEGTMADYEAWLKQPATDAATSTNTAEALRVTAEGLRATAETTRVQNEQGRVTAEGTRQQNETARGNSEDDRDAAETLRSSAETTREQNEQARVTAEGLRVTAEQARQTNTATAIQNANNAATNANTKAGLADTAVNNANAAEVLRGNAETTRVQNEQGRVTAEGLRVTAEQARQAAGYITSPSAMQIVQLTQAQYDALNPKIATTIYLIIQA